MFQKRYFDIFRRSDDWSVWRGKSPPRGEPTDSQLNYLKWMNDMHLIDEFEMSTGLRIPCRELIVEFENFFHF